MILEKNLAGKRLLGRPRMKREDLIKKEVIALNGGFRLNGMSSRQRWIE